MELAINNHATVRDYLLWLVSFVFFVGQLIDAENNNLVALTERKNFH